MVETPKIKSNPEYYVPRDLFDGDELIAVADLPAIAKELMARYGANAHIRFDGGHNNVSVVVEASKRVKGENPIFNY